MKNVTTTVNLNTQTVNQNTNDVDIEMLKAALFDKFKRSLALDEPVSLLELARVVKQAMGVSYGVERWLVLENGRYDTLNGQEVIYAWAYDYETDKAPRESFSLRDVVEHLKRDGVDELFWGYKYMDNDEWLLKGTIMAVKHEGIWYVSRETLEDYILECER